MQKDMLTSGIKAGTAIVRRKYSMLKIGAAVCLLLSISSCEVLDQEPQAEVESTIAIKDEQGAAAAMAGMYNQLQDNNYYGRNFQIMADISSDVAQSIGSWDFYREMDTYLISLDNRENGAFYTRAYRAINIANSIIQAVPAIEGMAETSKNNITGQAYFIRALAYFDLTRVYGGVPGVAGTLGVPLILTPTIVADDSMFIPRSSLQACYDQVESDLLSALELLPEAVNRSQAVKATARALLSRLYLYTDRPEAVVQYADLVIDNPAYTLVSDFASIFNDKLSAESVFELNFNSVDQSNMRQWYFPSSAGGRGDIAAHTEFYEEATADPKDKRGLLFAFAAGSGTYYPTKYQKSGNIDNIHVIRIAEIYLNRAEGRAKTGDYDGAVDDLNAIRSRAGVDEIFPAGENNILEAIWKERKLELAFEGHSFFDLVRTGLALTELASVNRTNGPAVSLSNPGRQVFPIPSFDMSANEQMEQNEAYR